jgi:hypothetical protein
MVIADKPTTTQFIEKTVIYGENESSVENLSTSVFPLSSTPASRIYRAIVLRSIQPQTFMTLNKLSDETRP